MDNGSLIRSFEALPATMLEESGELTCFFRERGFADIRSCGRYFMDLPYGRTASREDLRRVLIEERGTYSTKHAVLAELGREQGVAVFLMNEANTSGVGATSRAPWPE